jgi:hypothetical protein
MRNLKPNIRIEIHILTITHIHVKTYTYTRRTDRHSDRLRSHHNPQAWRTWTCED